MKHTGYIVTTDPMLCLGCRSCEMACILSHSDAADYGALVSAQRMPRAKIFFISSEDSVHPISCKHCADAPCVKVCPTNALFYEADIVLINKARCIGCKSCLLSCPFGMISYMPETGTVDKCDLCVDWRQKNNKSIPACIAACPTSALRFIDLDLLRTQRQNQVAAINTEMYRRSL